MPSNEIFDDALVGARRSRASKVGAAADDGQDAAAGGDEPIVSQHVVPA